MRQAGYLAAAGIFALENHIDRLATDHLHAQHIAKALKSKSWVANVLPVETNMVIFDIREPYSAKSLANKLKENGILCIPISEKTIRMVTHLNVTSSMAEQVVKVIEGL